jgi:hypothetical protein
LKKKGCHFFNPQKRDRNMKRIITPKSLKSSHLGVFFFFVFIASIFGFDWLLDH